MWPQSTIVGIAISGVITQLEDAGFHVIASVSDVVRQGFNLFAFEVIVDGVPR